MTKEQIIEKVKKNMKSIGWLDYEKKIGIECWDKKQRETRDGDVKELYLVFFKTPDTNVEYNEKGELTSLIEGYYCSCYVDANTYEILYYSRPHGYIETDGTY